LPFWLADGAQVSSFSQAVAISAPLNIKKAAPLKENELQR
jgi:hypothetical protein